MYETSKRVYDDQISIFDRARLIINQNRNQDRKTVSSDGTFLHARMSFQY